IIKKDGSRSCWYGDYTPLEPPVDKCFFLRPYIDGHKLVHGGQGFSLTYFNDEGREVTSGTQYVRGNSDGTQDDKYFYCGPFDLSDWGGGEVKISLHSQRNLKFTSDRPEYLGEYIVVNYGKMFDYYIEDPKGAFFPNLSIIVYTRKNSANVGQTCEDLGENNQKADDVVMTFRPYMGDKSFYEQKWWQTGYTGSTGSTSISIKTIGEKRYSRLNKLTKTLSEDEFWSLLKTSNQKESIWDWEKNKYLSSSIITKRFDFGLSVIRNSYPTFKAGNDYRSSYRYDVPFYLTSPPDILPPDRDFCYRSLPHDPATHAPWQAKAIGVRGNKYTFPTILMAGAVTERLSGPEYTISEIMESGKYVDVSIPRSCIPNAKGYLLDVYPGEADWWYSRGQWTLDGIGMKDIIKDFYEPNYQSFFQIADSYSYGGRKNNILNLTLNRKYGKGCVYINRKTNTTRTKTLEDEPLEIIHANVSLPSEWY
ncbi:MAG: hypothetical protein D3922_06940, partial [Candidatus Electrothrix sp. AR1]|nr:hypothetical protein [Candidatus Electrothrix sp. AR1]